MVQEGRFYNEIMVIVVLVAFLPWQTALWVTAGLYFIRTLSQKINDTLGTALSVHGGGWAWWEACKDPAKIRQLPTEVGFTIIAHWFPKWCWNQGSFIGLFVLSMWGRTFSNKVSLTLGKWSSLKARLIFGRVGGSSQDVIIVRSSLTCSITARLHVIIILSYLLWSSHFPTGICEPDNWRGL